MLAYVLAETVFIRFAQFIENPLEFRVQPTLTLFQVTLIAPASTLSCETISFHAVEESVVPAFGRAPHADAAKEIPHQTSVSDAHIPRPICPPFRRFFQNSCMFRGDGS